jgi:hypothetical protein
MAFVVNIFILSRVSWRILRMMLQLLDQARNFGVFQSFLANNLEPIWYNEGEGKNGPFIFILPGKSINNQILFSLIVNDLMIIQIAWSPIFVSPRMKFVVPENIWGPDDQF